MGLEDAYGRARDIIGQEQAECLNVAIEVEQLRLAWRPEQIRVVVLAESHVWTSRDEIHSRVRLDDIETPFARFIYCLGYGEPQLVTPEVKPNSSTIQYWRLLYNTVHGPAVPHQYLMKSGKADAQRRARSRHKKKAPEV